MYKNGIQISHELRYDDCSMQLFKLKNFHNNIQSYKQYEIQLVGIFKSGDTTVEK